MRMILNGRKVGRCYEAVYYSRKAYFTKQGLSRNNVLHELYHHLVERKGLESTEQVEEKETNKYAKNFLILN